MPIAIPLPDGTVIRYDTGPSGQPTNSLGVQTPATNTTPVCTVLPVITGTPAIGQTLTVSNGSWSITPTGYAYQWYRSGKPIPGANAASYTVIAPYYDTGLPYDTVPSRFMLTARVFAVTAVSMNYATSAAIVVAALSGGGGGVTPAPVPSYALPAPSYAFSKENAQLAQDAKYLVVGGSAAATVTNGSALGGAALPVPGAAGTSTGDWFQGFEFTNGEVLDRTASAAAQYLIAGKGTNALGPAVNDTGITLMSGSDTNGFGHGFRVQAARGGGKWWPTADTAQSTNLLNTEPGCSYSVVYGQIGDYPFIALTLIKRLGVAVTSTPVILRPATANKIAGSTNYYTNSTGVPAWTNVNGSATYWDFIKSFGASVDSGDGSGAGNNRKGWAGSVSGFYNVWGTFPNTSGAPNSSTVSAIAAGTMDPAAVTAAASATLIYYNQLRAPGDLAPTAGTVTAAATEGGLAATVQVYSTAPIRTIPELSLNTYGYQYVFAMARTGSTGSVPFSGTYANGTPSAFQAKLVRKDNGATLVDWTNLSSATISGGLYSGVLTGVPAGVAFTRQVRWANQTGIAVTDADVQAVGIVIPMVGQSQTTNMLSPAVASGQGGTSGTLTPASSTNTWMSVIRPIGPSNTPYGAYSDTNLSAYDVRTNSLGVRFALYPCTQAGQAGDGCVSFYTSLTRHLAVPVMFVDMSRPGHMPYTYYLDQKPIAFDSFTGFAPNGSTTAFTITPVYNLFTAVSLALITKKGSLNLTLSNGVTITDDGAGNLVGTGVTGTINYKTSVLTATFTTAPASGVTISGGSTYASDDAYGTLTAKTTLNGYTNWGAAGSEHSGWIADAVTRLRGVPQTFVHHYWFTAFEGLATGYPAAAINANLDNLRARFVADYPAVFPSSIKWGVMMPQRETAAAEAAFGPSVQGNIRQIYRDMIAATPTSYGSLGDYYDMTNTDPGPHMDFAGGQLMGERDGIAVANAFGANVTAEGPVLTSAVCNGGRTTCVLTFTQQDGQATTLTTGDGSTTGILGIQAGASATTLANAGGSTFSAAITGANQITLTSNAGAFPTPLYVGIGSGVPISTGAGNYATDVTNLGKLVYDNAATSAGAVAKYSTSGKPGNLARAVRNVQAA